MTALRLLATGLATALPVFAAMAQDTSLESDWLELVRGHKGEKLGLEVRESQVDPETGKRQLVIAVPKVSMGDRAAMEEVRVVGRRPEGMKFPDLLPDLEYEWVDDYENDHYGLLVRFTEDQETPVRIYFNSATGFIER